MTPQEHNHVFGRLVLRLNLINRNQLSDVDAIAARSSDVGLATLLVERGLITEAERAGIEASLEQLVIKHGGDLQGIEKSIDSDSAAELAQVTDPFEETVIRSAFQSEKQEELSAGLESAAFEETFISNNPAADVADPSGLMAETVDHDGPASLEKGAGETSSSVRIRLDTLDSGPSQNSRYSLTRLCGKGGIGEVWLTLDPNLNRDIALKRFRADRKQSPEIQRQLIKEAQITGQLEHPNIIPIHELNCLEDGSPYYTMKLLRGVTLSRKIKDYHTKLGFGTAGAVDLHDLLNAFIDICNAINYAGTRGIVHRDLKPQNIMLGDYGEVIVLDWGLAMIVEQLDSDDKLEAVSLQVPAKSSVGSQAEGEIVGTPAYMAPEQATGRISLIDHRTDVYGLGGVLFAILAGRSPHSKDQNTGNSAMNTRKLLKQIAEGPPPSPRAELPAVPAPLDAICVKALSRRRSQRYQNAGELALDVKRWMADEAVSAYPEPWNEKARRWLRRHRAMAQSIGIAVVVIAAVSTIAAVLVNGAHQRELTAHADTREAHENLKIANAAEVAAKEDARLQFQRARQAVDESLIGVSEGLVNTPGAQEFRVRFLEKAAQDYEKFANEKSDDTELKIEFARALIRVGDVRRLLNQFEEAKSSYESAISRLKECLPPDRQSLEFAPIHDKLGVLYATFSHLKEAEAEYRIALDLLKTSAKAGEQGNAELQVQAVIQGNLGVMLSRAARYDEALTVLKQAEQNWTAYSDATKSADGRESLAKIRISLGEHFRETGKLDEALAELKRAAVDYKQLVDQHPSQPTFLQGLADCRLNLAGTFFLLGETDKQIAAYEEVIPDYVALIKTRPDIPVYRENLSAAETNLAQALYRLGKNKEARDASITGLQLAMDLVDEHPQVIRYYVTQVYARLTLAQILRDAEEFMLAQQHTQQAIDMCMDLIDAQSKESNYHRLLGEARNNLGLIHFLTADYEQARQSFVSAGFAFQKALDIADSPATRDGMAWSLSYLGDTLHRLGQATDSAATYQRAIDARAKITDKNPNDLANEAWLLVTCLDVKLRNPLRAIELAGHAVQKVPGNDWYQTVLAAAHLRNGDADQCLRGLEAALKFRVGLKDTIVFWKAMALWDKGDKNAAKTAFEQAVKRMNETAPGDIKLRLLKDEAGTLLGIPPEPADVN